MKTQRINLLKVIVALVSLVVFVSTGTIKAQDNHYKPDFISQMVYQLSSEVIDHSGLIKLALKQSETRPTEEMFVRWIIPAGRSSFSPKKDESERVPLEEFLLKAAQPYQAGKYIETDIEENAMETGISGELEALLIRAARPYNPCHFSQETPAGYDALEKVLFEAARPGMYCPPKIEVYF